MTQLLIKLYQPLAQGYVKAGAIASVQRLSDIAGKLVKPLWTQEKPVDVAGGDGRTGEHSRFNLPGGGYYSVEITVPRGASISREFLVRDEEVRTETIKMEASPHEYLGWQQYAGIVPSSLNRADAQIGSKGLALQNSRAPVISTATLPSTQGAWAMVKEGRREIFIYPRPPLQDYIRDEQFVTWFPRMPEGNEGLALINELKQAAGGADPRFPRWMAFDSGSHLDIASVPWPWWGYERHPDERIVFLYETVSRGSVDRQGRLVVSVQDHRWFGLLEFLSSGRLSRARENFDAALSIDDPELALYGKVKGPLIAVAGGIVLVSQTQTSEEQRWDHWLENLTNWFPGIPDGPILLGSRQVQKARTEAEFRKAYDNLRIAIDRGIPFFSASLRMLGLALAQISGEISEAEQLRRLIAPVSTRVDPDQPFTVIRL